ncbi:MAG: Hsp33 family molecular chaperone HslO [Woeseiaceae bacterium]
MKDTLQRFLFENLAVRGELVHLDATWQAIREQHDYPLAVQTVLGELMVSVSLLIATLKFKGKMIAQIQGDGPVSLMVVEGSSEKTLRATATLKNPSSNITQTSLKELFGEARFIITIEPDEGERYQGIVALSGESIADALTDYLLRSEQLDSGIWLAADEHQCAGLLVQKLPETEKTQSNPDVDGWNRIQQLSSTIKNDELLNLSSEEVIHRLYHEEDIRLFDAETISFRCTCSHGRVAKMLLSLGAEEVQSMIKELTSIEVDCEYCGHSYHFDAVDTAQIFSTKLSHTAPNSNQ